MQISSIPSATAQPPLNRPRAIPKPDDLPLEQLAGSTQLSEPQKIKQVSRAFEAVLLRQILREGQSPVFKSKLAGNSATDNIYRDLASEQLADAISKSGSFGLAKILSSELQPRPTSPGPSSNPSSPPLSRRLPRHLSRPIAHPLSHPAPKKLESPHSLS